MSFKFLLSVILFSTTVSAQVHQTDPVTDAPLYLEAQRRHESWMNELTTSLMSHVPGNCKLIQIADGAGHGYGENYQGPTLNIYLNMNGQNVSMNIPVINGANEPRSGISILDGGNVGGEYHMIKKFWRKNYSNEPVQWKFLKGMVPTEPRDEQWINEEHLIYSINVSGKIGAIHYIKMEVKNGAHTGHKLMEQRCQ